jgi:hypothetical protein
MQLVSLKSGLATVWILAVLIAGLAGRVHTLSSWAVLAVTALLPPLLMMWFLNNPTQTMSESINEARR